MTNKAARKFRRRLVAILLPPLVIAAGLLSIVASSYWSREQQSDKYALPADRSAVSMLAFLRRLDAEYEPRESLISESNLPAINDAVRSATRVLDQNRSDLSPAELHEADYYRLRFGYLALMSGSSLDKAEEWKLLLAKTQAFVAEARQVSSKESNIVGYALAGLDYSGRTAEGIELANQIEDKFRNLPDGHPKTTTLSNVANIRRRLQLLGKKLELATYTLAGQPIHLRDLSGKVVLLEFWSTTCGPCLADFPALKRIYSTYHDQGFEVLAVCLHASAVKIETFTKEHQLPWIQICHDHIEGNDEWAAQFGIQAVPTTILISRTGEVLRFGVRPLHLKTELDLEENLKSLSQRHIPHQSGRR